MLKLSAIVALFISGTGYAGDWHSIQMNPQNAVQRIEKGVVSLLVYDPKNPPTDE
ncbi:MAG: hypothetical protein AB7T49_17700 [Oligoflexales bacterium]